MQGCTSTKLDQLSLTDSQLNLVVAQVERTKEGVATVETSHLCQELRCRQLGFRFRISFGLAIVRHLCEAESERRWTIHIFLKSEINSSANATFTFFKISHRLECAGHSVEDDWKRTTNNFVRFGLQSVNEHDQNIRTDTIKFRWARRLKSTSAQCPFAIAEFLKRLAVEVIFYQRVYVSCQYRVRVSQ